MRLLFLSDFCPWPLNNGYRQRVYHLIQALTRVHEVTLATLMPESIAADEFPPAAHCAELIRLSDVDCEYRSTGRYERWAPARHRLATLLSSPYPNVVRRWRSAGIGRQLVNLLRRGHFDAVWAERPFIAELARRAGFTRILVDLPDVESVAAARGIREMGCYASKPLHHAELAKLFAYDQALPWRFWRVAVCKEDDRRFFGTHRANVITVPNGVVAYPPSPEPPAGPPQLLFVGGLNYESNIVAVKWFAQSVMPLIRRRHPSAQFVAIGPDPVPSVLDMHERGECTVRTNIDDLGPHFDDATVVVAPIRLGSGTRLKVLEGMVRKRAMVATSTAAEGLDVRRGVDLEIANSADEFAAACGQLLDDPTRRRQLAASGRERVLGRYLWSHVGQTALAALTEAPHAAYPESPSNIALARNN